ncbi:MAG: alpha/beta hydrolase, partial [Selenomonadaceae bacterium]|nr:alpha/beta hydrolase [Selenomonadaceae bacterium]
MLKKFLFALMILFLIPLTVTAQSKDVTIDGDHGKLSAILQTPDGQEKFPLVILCHGFNADKNYLVLKSLADDLETRGIASIRF